MAQQRNDFSKGSIPKTILSLAAPMTMAQLINVLYSVVDRMYLGRLPGHLALTGLGLTMPIISILMGFANLCGMGGAPLCSIYRGKGENEEAEYVMGNSFTLLLILGVLATAVCLLIKKPMLYLFGASDATFPYADAYLTIYLLGTIFVMVSLGLNPFINSQGFAKTGMMTVGLGAVVNIVLDPVFIFALDMGVQGAALATVLSQGASCLWILCFLRGKQTTLRLQRRTLRLRRKILLPCLALGVSPFIMQFTESILNVCFNTSLLQYGGDLAVGAMTILASVMQFAMLPLQGFTQGAQPIVGFNYGAGNRDRVKETFRRLLVCCIVYAGIIWAVAMFLPQVFTAIFTNDPALAEYTQWAIRIYLALAFLMGIQVACQQTFIALGNAKTSVFLALLRKVILLIPLIYLLPHLLPGNQVMAVFLAEPVADAIAVATTGTLFWRQYHKL